MKLIYSLFLIFNIFSADLETLENNLSKAREDLQNVLNNIIDFKDKNKVIDAADELEKLYKGNKDYHLINDGYDSIKYRYVKAETKWQRIKNWFDDVVESITGRKGKKLVVELKKINEVKKLLNTRENKLKKDIADFEDYLTSGKVKVDVDTVLNRWAAIRLASLEPELSGKDLISKELRLKVSQELLMNRDRLNEIYKDERLRFALPIELRRLLFVNSVLDDNKISIQDKISITLNGYTGLMSIMPEIAPEEFKAKLKDFYAENFTEFIDFVSANSYYTQGFNENSVELVTNVINQKVESAKGDPSEIEALEALSGEINSKSLKDILNTALEKVKGSISRAPTPRGGQKGGGADTTNTGGDDDDENGDEFHEDF